jgi:hypothetical protein
MQSENSGTLLPDDNRERKLKIRKWKIREKTKAARKAAQLKKGNKHA